MVVENVERIMHDEGLPPHEATRKAMDQITGALTGSLSRFNGPNSVAVDAAGNIYVADETANTVRKITAAGVVSTLAGFAH